MNIRLLPITFAASLVAGLATTGHAVTVYGLTTRDQLIQFDSSTPNMVVQANFISGLASNESLIGIDFRPANGMLYGLGSMGRLYTLNTMNGQATFVSSLFDSTTMSPILLNGSEFGVDFNPVVDRLRVTSNGGQNLRINVATGATIVDGTLNQGSGTPHVVASGYSNNFAGATSTTLYNLDSASDMLNTQVPANSGTQVGVGSLGMDITGLAGMDILTVGSTQTAYVAVQQAGVSGSSFGTVALGSGMITLTGPISMNQSSDSLAVRDIALTPVPEPASLAVIGLGTLGLLRRRRRN